MTIDEIDNRGHIRHLDRNSAIWIDTGDRHAVIVNVDGVDRLTRRATRG